MMNTGARNPAGYVLGLVITCGGIICYNNNPRFYSEIYNNKNDDNEAIIKLMSVNDPKIQTIKHYNLECLKEQGYISSEKNPLGFNRNRIVYMDKKNIDIKELLLDCKRCNVYSDIEYSYKPLLSDKHKDTSTRVHWDSCHIRKYFEYS